MFKRLFLLSLLFCALTTISFNTSPAVGTVIDELNGVAVYFNGHYDTTHGRNVTPDGYNLGLKYQCVEFIKRYYYLRFNHKMPDSYGHAVHFFDRHVKNDASYNRHRGLYQYWNGNTTPPKVDDILVLKTEGENPFGHIGIVSHVDRNSIEIVQQNYGTKTRIKYPIKYIMDRYYIDDKEILGWLSRN